MMEEINLFFTREGICNTIEGLRLASEKYGFIKIDEISVDIRTGTDLNARIKPFEYKEELAPIKDWKGKLNTVNVVFPLNSGKMDKLYGRKRKISSMYGDCLGLRFPSVSKEPDSWDYHNLELYSLPLCETYRVKKAIENMETYNSDECCSCPEKVKDYCKDINSILSKNALPRNINFEFTGANR